MPHTVNAAVRNILPYVIAAIILVCLPFVSFHQRNYADASFIPGDFYVFWLTTAAAILAAIFALSAALSFIAKAGTRGQLAGRIMISAAGTFFFVFLFDGFSSATSSVLSAGATLPVFCALLVVVFGIVFYLARFKEFVGASLIFAAAPFVVALPAMAGTLSSLLPAALTQHSTPISAPTDRETPNVYYFIVDGFTSAAVIRDRMKFDLAPYIDEMQKLGFTHAASAYSSFNMTTLSLTSIFLARYELTPNFPNIGDRKGDNLYPRMLRGRDEPSTITKFKDLGYDFYVVGNRWGRCGGPFVFCYDDGTENKIGYLTEAFWSASPLAILYRQPKQAKTGQKSERPDVDAIEKVHQRLKAEGKPARPRFTFVHHLAPHPPYLFHSDCSERPIFDNDLTGWAEEGIPLYVENVQCTVDKMLAISRSIIADDPGAIIVFQGDHGSAFDGQFSKPLVQWSADAIRERSSIMNLVRLPPACASYLPTDADNVATIRAVMSCVSGKPGEPFEIRHYVGTYSEKSEDAGIVRRIDPIDNVVFEDDASFSAAQSLEGLESLKKSVQKQHKANRKRYDLLLPTYREKLAEMRAAEASGDAELSKSRRLDYQKISKPFRKARSDVKDTKDRLTAIDSRIERLKSVR